MKLTVTTLVLIEDTSNQYPIGWEWLDKVPLEDFTWLIEVFATMTDDINTYDFLSYDQELSPSLVNIDRKGLAYFLNHDQETTPNAHSSSIYTRKGKTSIQTRNTHRPQPRTNTNNIKRPTNTSSSR